jgi:hypothetical protein
MGSKSGSSSSSSPNAGSDYQGPGLAPTYQ